MAASSQAPTKEDNRHQRESRGSESILVVEYEANGKNNLTIESEPSDQRIDLRAHRLRSDATDYGFRCEKQQKQVPHGAEDDCFGEHGDRSKGGVAICHVEASIALMQEQCFRPPARQRSLVHPC